MKQHERHGSAGPLHAMADLGEEQRVRVRRMAVALSVAAVFVVVIPASVQEEGGWQLPGLGSSHRQRRFLRRTTRRRRSP